MDIHKRFNGETSFHYLLTRLTTVTSPLVESRQVLCICLLERSLESIKLICGIYYVRRV